MSNVKLFALFEQVKDVLFEPVRKTQDAVFFVKNLSDMWVPCGPNTRGALQTTMQDLAARGLASQVSTISLFLSLSLLCHETFND